METRAPRRDPDAGWQYFPPDIRDALQGTGMHPLVVLEMLQDDECLADLAESMSTSRGGETSVWKARFSQFAAVNAGRRHRMEQEFLRDVRRPRLAGASDTDSSRVQDAYQDMTTLLTAVDRKLHQSRLSSALGEGIEDPESAEQADRIRWIRVSVQFIVDAGLPVVSLVPDGAESGAVWVRLFVNRRAKTLRNRARCWKRYVEWLSLVRGISWPRHFADVPCWHWISVDRGRYR